jgi:hypothetical protein
MSAFPVDSIVRKISGSPTQRYIVIDASQTDKSICKTYPVQGSFSMTFTDSDLEMAS